ncbi:MAG: hypothetical protein IPG14_19040 [Dehalococcoidia bacterium]|nr:hypothetical protein [Dehalococcoidia bacterium]
MVHPDGRIYVVDYLNNRIQVFRESSTLALFST